VEGRQCVQCLDGKYLKHTNSKSQVTNPKPI